MRAHHLKKIGDTWHYQRRIPKEFEDIEPPSLIRFSLKTKEFSKARALAAKTSLKLEKEWQSAQLRGVSLKSVDEAERYQAALETNQHFGLQCQSNDQFSEDELLNRLRILLHEKPSIDEQKAVLGLVKEPCISLAMAFDRFWEHILDERMSLSKDQQRVKRNIYLKAIRNFEEAIGFISIHELCREHAMQFKSWWVNRIEETGLKPYTANRAINSLRRMLSVNFDIDGVERVNLFQRIGGDQRLSRCTRLGRTSR